MPRLMERVSLSHTCSVENQFSTTAERTGHAAGPGVRSARTAIRRCRQSCLCAPPVRCSAVRPPGPGPAAGPEPCANPEPWPEPWPDPWPGFLLLARWRSVPEDVALAPERTGPVLYCVSMRSSAAVRPPEPRPAWRFSSENSANAPPAVQSACHSFVTPLWGAASPLEALEQLQVARASAIYFRLHAARAVHPSGKHMRIYMWLPQICPAQCHIICRTWQARTLAIVVGAQHDERVLEHLARQPSGSLLQPMHGQLCCSAMVICNTPAFWKASRFLPAHMMNVICPNGVMQGQGLPLIA